MMKRTKILILLLTFLLLGGSALEDDNNDEDIPYIEITEGEIEFKVDIFGFDKMTTEEEVDDYDEEDSNLWVFRSNDKGYVKKLLMNMRKQIKRSY